LLRSIDRYKSDLESLIDKGGNLLFAISNECDPTRFMREARRMYGDKAEGFVRNLPYFADEYQTWYSEAKSLISQLLPCRLSDFEHLYEKPKPRKTLTCESYRIEDCLQDLSSTGFDGRKIVGPDAAVPLVRQQLAILKAVRARFESSLFDIGLLVQADLFDSELDAADELLKHKFVRPAGVLAGVVLERHLAQVCANHGVKIAKKDPGIAELSEALRQADVINLPQSRRIQALADTRNLCAHNKKKEPTPEEADELIVGVKKTIKTLF